MTDAFDHTGLPEDEALAAEYALGVLSGEERAAVEARIARDRAFALLVEGWEHRLAPWAAEVESVEPPAHVWSALAARLPPASRAGAGMWESLPFWRIFAIASTLAAACLAIFIALSPGWRSEPLVASIEGGGRRQFVATVDAARGSVVAVPAAYAGDPSRVPQLWLIPGDGKPRPLGLLSGERTVTLTVPAEFAKALGRNAVLAVSLEPPGGSPTGQPTGPVIGSGPLTSL
jgi:anti-sigma-K factor RskA